MSIYTIITPGCFSSSTGYDITYYLTSFYDTLVTYNENNELVGSLAEDWSMSDDGKYTFHIKEGIKFSDGSDLTAEDVAKSLMAVLLISANIMVVMVVFQRLLKVPKQLIIL